MKKSVKGEEIPGYNSNVIQDSWRPSCPFCHAKWTDSMIQLETVGSGYCDTCYSESPKIEINCHECKRLIYTKEGSY